MRARYDAYFSTMARLEQEDLPSRDRLQQLNKLSESLRDWGTEVLPGESFDLYLHYKEHGTLPYAGALMDQPMYIRREFTRWTLLEQWHRLNERLPSIDGLPSAEELV